LLEKDEPAEAKVNSSHHQAIRTPGDNLRVVAVSPADGVVEGVELDSADHFVVGVQWHPERTYTQSAFSRSIFAAFLSAAQEFESRNTESSVVQNG
jgi:putative glutamine amidotransferase